MTDTPNLALPLMAAAQAQKHVTHNEALAMLDALTQLSVASRAITAPPSTPAEGTRLLVPAGGASAFAGKVGQIALFDGGLWRFLPPKAGWLAYVADEGAALVHDGAAWVALGQAIGAIDQLASLGIGTASDAVNRLAVRAQGTLMTARRIASGGTGDMRLTVEKEAAARTASLLFQTGYSGRAEMGLIGDDGFRMKVSPDGETWHDAITVDGGTGQVSFPGGVSGLTGGAAGQPLGQVRLDLVSGQLRLMPCRGNLLTVNGASAVVPAAGVSLAATGLAANTTYYVYAVAAAGSVTTLEVSTSGWATHVDGTAIKTGDPSRALVGMARTIAGPAFMDSAKQRLVASWFNRVSRIGTSFATTDRSSASTAYVEPSTDFRVEFVAWADQTLLLTASGATYNSVAGTAHRFSFGIDSATPIDSWSYVLNSFANSFAGFVCSGVAQQAEGYHHCTLLLSVTAGTGSIGGGASPGARSALSLTISA